MATRFIDKETGATTSTAIANDSTGTTKIKNLPDAVGFVFDNVDKKFKYNDGGTIREQLTSAAPVSATATLAVTASLHAHRTVLLSAVAGFTSTLPAATGTGDKYRFVVGTALTSATYVVKAAGSDLFKGGVHMNDAGDTSPALPEFYPTASNTNTFTMAFSIGAGKIGDWFELEDIASATWAIRGVIQSVTDPSTPLSNT